MNHREIATESCYWIAAIALGLTPAILATDFGGILPWPMHVSALLLTAACWIAFAAKLISIGCRNEAQISPAAFTLSGLLLALLMGASLQTVPLPQSWLAWMSPASYSAHVTWVGELIGVDPKAKLPISIASFDSLHAIAYLSIATLVAFFSVLIFKTRGRITWMLSSIAIGASSIALIGLARKLIPEFQLWSFRIGGEGAPFGTFLNRNNAAFGINLGIAASLGLVIWRMMAQLPPALSQQPRHPQRRSKPWSAEWIRDPLVVMAFLAIGVCLVGLISCGSRGGLLAMVIAVAVTLAAVRHQIGNQSGRIASALGAIAVIAMILIAVLRTDKLGNQALRGDTIEQIGSTVQSSSKRLESDTRLAHWPDGFRTAVKHFPFGSGLATYGYAYLPWQQTSPWRRCLHADNLWLEMLVELGIGGLVLALVCGWLIYRCLARLSASPDPMDQGLRVAGCYASVMLLISQFFDFGLILPANSIATVILFSVILARASAVVPAKHVPGSGQPNLVLLREGIRWWKSPQFLRETLFQTSSAIVLLVIALGAVQRLKLDSEVDTLVRSVDSHLQDNRFDFQRLGEIIAQHQQLARLHPHPDLFESLAKLEFQRGRLLELANMNVGRMPDHQQQQMYSMTSFTQRRLSWRSSEPALAQSVTHAGQPVPSLPLTAPFLAQDSPYVDAIKHAESLLRSRPLALSPRIDQVSLEFIHQSPNRTHVAISQSADLFRNNPELQLRFGAQAADNGDYELALTAWQRAADLQPNMIKRVLGRAARFPNFPLADLVPQSPQARELASQFLETMNVNIPNPNQIAL